MIRTTSRMATSAALLLTALTAACSDQGVTNPVASPAASPLEFASPAYASVPSTSLSQQRVGDTTVTVFVLGTNNRSTTQYIGNGSTIKFPLGAASVCNITRSTYGPGTWDTACAGSTRTVTITAKTWINATGTLSSEFSPAMRFVPASNNSVMVSFPDISGTAKRIDFCTSGSCVDESSFDAALYSTVYTPPSTNSFARSVPVITRRIKHFSGYSVTAD